MGCERCEDWQRQGLSSTCPACVQYRQHSTSLDEWVDKYASDLRNNFEITLGECSDITSREAVDMTRMLMIMVRDWDTVRRMK